MADPDRAAYVVSPKDRSGLVVISATLFMSWMVLVSLVRLYIRTTMNGPFGPDDLAALSASVCLFRFALFRIRFRIPVRRLEPY
jgi:hypothetical protein